MEALAGAEDVAAPSKAPGVVLGKEGAAILPAREDRMGKDEVTSTGGAPGRVLAAPTDDKDWKGDVLPLADALVEFPAPPGGEGVVVQRRGMELGSVMDAPFGFPEAEGSAADGVAMLRWCKRGVVMPVDALLYYFPCYFI